MGAPLPPDESQRLSEAEAHRLLARALELEQLRGSDLTIAQLHDAAREVGISDAAFRAAVQEARAKAPEPKRPLAIVVLTNLLAGVAFWGLYVLLAQLAVAADVPWTVRKLLDVLTLVVGVAVAHKLSARVARFAFLGLAIAAAAELVLDVVFGTPAVLGSGSHLALWLGSFGGLAAGTFLASRHGSAPPTPLPLLESVAPAPDANPHAPTPDHLRQVLTVLRGLAVAPDRA
jgi:hypothetical protein